MKNIRIIARHPLGVILELIVLVSVAIIVCKPVALARVGPKWIPTGSLHMATTWGGDPQDIPVPEDYDGDGKTDIAVYRDGMWFIIQSSDGGQTTVGWGGDSLDIPLPADYDGDGKADLAVYRDGVWFILRSSDGGQTTVSWGGVLSDVPVPADYDGDGKVDVAVYRHGMWLILPSSNHACEGCWDY